jgi:hypothetical protein
MQNRSGLVLLNRQLNFCGFVGDPTGLTCVSGEEVCVGDDIEVSPGEGHHSRGDIVAVFGEKYGLMGVANQPLEALKIIKIQVSHKTLAEGNKAGRNQDFSVVEWKGVN